MFLFRKANKGKKTKPFRRRPLLNVKIGLIATLIVTAVIGVYGIELGIRVSTGNGRFEILGIVVILLVLLFFADLILLAKHKKSNAGKFF